MIDTIKMTPGEYSAQSRDYQVIARLYTALFNLSKMYIDNNHFWTNDIDKKLSRLRAFTLNFRNKYQWDLDELKVVSSCFKYLMFRKGTKTALIYCIYILMRLKNLEGTITEDNIVIENNVITIRVPENLTNLGAIEDLIRYLIPAGYTYKLVVYKELNLGRDIPTVFKQDIVTVTDYPSSKLVIRSDSGTDIDSIVGTGYMGSKITNNKPQIPYGTIEEKDYLPGSIGNTIVIGDGDEINGGSNNES